jgi:hypothetical protein
MSLSIGVCRLFMHDTSSSNQSTLFAAIACSQRPGPLHESCRGVGPASAAIRLGVRDRQSTVTVGLQSIGCRAVAASSKTRRCSTNWSEVPVLQPWPFVPDVRDSQSSVAVGLHESESTIFRENMESCGGTGDASIVESPNDGDRQSSVAKAASVELLLHTLRSLHNLTEVPVPRL